MKQLILLLLLLLALIVMAALNSCNSPKQIQRRLDKAYNTVSLDSNAREKMWRLVNSYKPVNDTVIRYKPGRVDTISIKVTVPVTDQSELKRLRDSINQIYSDCDEAIKATQSATSEYYKRIISGLSVSVPVKAPDTASISIFERAKYESQIEQTNSWHNRASYLEGFSAHQKETINKKEATIRVLYGIISGLVILILLYAGIKLYSKFKKK
jgi:predicted RND superfamily exporter protein